MDYIINATNLYVFVSFVVISITVRAKV